MLIRRIILSLVVFVSTALLGASALVPAATAAGIWYVSNSGSDGNDCATPSTPCASINAALNKSGFVAGDTVEVAVGTYVGSGTQVVTVSKDATLSGGWDSTFSTQSGMSTVDGQGSRRGFGVGSGKNVVISRFVVQDGAVLTWSPVGSGGGIFNAGNLSLDNSVVAGNWVAGDGGGIENTSHLILNNSSVTNNHGTDGAGIYNNPGDTAVLNNSTVSLNRATTHSAGVFNSGTMVLNNTTVSDNQSPSGSGILNTGTLSSNGSTIAMNNSYSSAGGILTQAGANTTLQNTIVAQNIAPAAPDCSGPIASSGYNLIGNSSGCTFSSSTGDLLNRDPQLYPLVAPTGLPMYHPLASSSPAMDAGNPSGCSGSSGPLTKDQRGVARVGRCDIGAFEYTTPGSLAGIYANVVGQVRLSKPFSGNASLQAAALDAAGSPVTGVEITFTAPTSGPGGTFGGSESSSATTGDDGLATVSFTPNGVLGSYSVAAQATGGGPVGVFSLVNEWWYVSPSGSDGNDCQGPATTCATVSGVLSKPSFVFGDGILLSRGTYTGGGMQVILLTKNANLSGGWDASFTNQIGSSTVDGQYSREALNVAYRVTASVDRLEVRNGFATQGGGIENQGVLTVTNCRITNNFAQSAGGGIDNMASLLTLVNTTVDNNQAAQSGGGIESSGLLWIVNSTISQNASGLSGSGGAGGGIDASSTSLYIYSSSISGNRALGSQNGGGINNSGGSTFLTDSILSGNYASAAPDCSGTVISSGYNILGNTSGCSITAAAGDQLNVDAKLGSLQDNGGGLPVVPLTPGSPAIDSGNPAGCADNLGSLLTTDQRRFPRFGRCDVGSFEIQPVEFVSISAKSATPVGDSLGYTITLSNPGATDLSAVSMTDPLPPALVYTTNSLSATSGSVGYGSGVISWNGTVPAAGTVIVKFGAKTSMVGFVSNSATITGGGETITRTATTNVTGQVCITKNAANPVLAPGSSGAWDAAGVFNPSVIKEGSTYKMWYAGNAADGTRAIGYATSSDGRSWSKSGSNPVLSPSATWEGSRVGFPSVIDDGGTFKMWYVGRDASNVNRIGYATSPDGVSWTEYGSNPVLGVGASGSWDSKYLTTPSVVKVGSTYHMWYGGSDGSAVRIGHATSDDGVNWAKDPANPVLDIGTPGSWEWIDVYAPRVLYVNGNFFMWYSGDALPTASQTGYAISTDGTNWVRGAKVISEGAPGSFDSASADYVSALVDGSGYDIWYSGMNAAGVYSIGYAGTQTCGSPSAPSHLVFLPMTGKGIGGSVMPACPALYTDNFGDPTSGWPIEDDTNHTDAYVGGEYQMLVKTSSQGWMASPGGLVTDFAAAVTARTTTANTGLFGIDFGISADGSQYYEYDLSGNAFSVWKWDGAWTALQPWASSNYIAAGTGSNRMKVVRSGTDITVYANDHPLTKFSDSSFSGPRFFGLAVSSPSTGSIDVRFDDFALYPANCASNARAPVKLPAFHLGPPVSRHVAVPPPAR